MKSKTLDYYLNQHLESLAISAGAGSGKTYALTGKLLLLLLGGAKISEILAITFTNKAAGEIKDRLLTRLDSIAAEKDNSIPEFCNILGIDKTELIRRTKTLQFDLIRYFSSLKISTIDSFLASVIKQFPSDTGIGLDVNIIDDIERKIIFNDALEKFYRVINSNPKLFNKVFSYLQSRNQKSFKTKRIFEDFFNNFNTNYFKLIESSIYKPDFTEKAEKRYNEIKNYIKSREFENLINKTLENFSQYLTNEKVYDKRNIKGLHKKLKEFLTLKNIYILQSISIFQTKDPADKRYIRTISKTKPELWEPIISNLRDIKKTINNYVKTKIDYQFYSKMEIFSVIREQFSEIKSEKNILDFEDIEFLSYQFLKQLEEFNYFEYRMDTPIKYILIDEFQDTSELQWNTIEPIVEEAIQTGGKLIYVGDVKQSIYQWRGGNPELFKTIKTKYKLKEEKLSTNYRSTPIILSFINSIFSDISDRIEEFIYEPQTLPSESKNTSNNSGYVYVKAISEYSEIGTHVVDQIKKLNSNGVNYMDIAVLCEKNDQISELESLLKMNGIPYIGSGKKPLLEDYAVIDIINILKFISSPLEEIYLAAILRSPIFRIKYDTLFNIKQEGEKISLNSLKKYEPLIYETLEDLIKSSRYLSVSKLLLKLFEVLSTFEVYPENRDAILDLLEISYGFEAIHSETSLIDFIEYLDKSGSDIKSNTASINGVQLSTIHSAKGLEYHTVIIPFLTTKRNLKLDGQYRFKEDNKNITGFIELSREFEYYYPDDDYEKILAKVKKDHLLEKINLLYVALTRAKNNLIVLPSFDNKTIGGIFLESLYPAIDFKEEAPKEYESGKIVPSEKKDKESSIWYNEITIKKSKLPTFSISMQNDESNHIEGDIFNRRISMLKGLIVHRMLFYIKKLPINEDEFSRLLNKALSYEGKDFTKLERNKTKPLAESSVKNILEDNRIFRFFSDNSQAEVTTISDKYQNLVGRIDRILINKNTVEIIDFKTDSIKNNEDIERLISTYKKQITSYCKTVKDIFPEKEVKGYIYFTDAPYDSRLQKIL